MIEIYDDETGYDGSDDFTAFADKIDKLFGQEITGNRSGSKSRSVREMKEDVSELQAALGHKQSFNLFKKQCKDAVFSLKKASYMTLGQATNALPNLQEKVGRKAVQAVIGHIDFQIHTLMDDFNYSAAKLAQAVPEKLRRTELASALEKENCPHIIQVVKASLSL